MNIDEYRAMIAEETAKAQEQSSTPEPETNETVEETTPEAPETQESAPAKVIVDDVEYDVDTIRALRDGSLRQADYTRKTQEVARKERENQEAIELFNHLQKNPKILEALKNNEELSPEDVAKLQALDPTVLQAQRNERELADLRLQVEIGNLERKYPDFNTMQVLQIAYEKQLPNLEDAYLLSKAQSQAAPSTPPAQASTPDVDVDKLREEIRAQLRAELDAERASTQTIISSGGNAPQAEKEIEISADQMRVFRMQGLSDEDIKKWYKPK